MRKRRRIMDAIAELSAEQGYEATKIGDIVRRAGVARKTLYDNFDGKEEVYLAAIDSALKDALARVEEACAEADDDWPARVEAALTALLAYLAENPAELAVADGLFLSLDLSGPADRVVGYRAKKNSLPVDLSKVRAYRWTDYWDPVHPEPGGRIVLEPEIFYLLLSAEGVSILPQIAAEMMAYDPTAGELRTHYAGFFDPGFGYDPAGERHGSRAALEVRARDVSFMVEHRQPVCKLGLEWMEAPAERLYGADLGSNYQGQVTMLSKHFEEQTAGAPVA